MRVLRGLKVWLILAVLAMSIWAPPRTAREVSPGGREEPEGKPTHRVAAISRIPFELSGNHIFIRPRLNKAHKLWFILDTGAVQTQEVSIDPLAPEG